MELASCDGSICDVVRVRIQMGLDLDLLAERRPQQFRDIENGAVDVDVARLQCLPAGKGEQMLDQFGAAIGGIVDQGRHVQQIRAVGKAGHQRFGGAGDDREHVVEIVRHAAG